MSGDFAPPGEFAGELVNSHDYAAERRGGAIVAAHVPHDTSDGAFLYQTARDNGYVAVDHVLHDGGEFAVTVLFSPLSGVDMRGSELPTNGRCPDSECEDASYD